MFAISIIFAFGGSALLSALVLEDQRKFDVAKVPSPTL